jgi:hypothetical protein
MTSKGHKVFANFDMGIAMNLLSANHFMNNYTSKSLFINGTYEGSFIIAPGVNYKITDDLSATFLPKFSFAFQSLKDIYPSGYGRSMGKNYIKYVVFNFGFQYNF